MKNLKELHLEELKNIDGGYYILGSSGWASFWKGMGVGVGVGTAAAAAYYA